MVYLGQNLCFNDDSLNLSNDYIQGVKMKNVLKEVQIYLNDRIEYEFSKEKNKQPKPSDKALEKFRKELEDEYQIDNWLKNCKNSLEFMQEIGFSLATHIAKGIHSSSKSTNVIFQKKNENKYVGSHSLKNLRIDSNNSNTAVYVRHLTYITSLLNIAFRGERIHNLITNNDKEVVVFFNEKFSADSFFYLQDMLNINIEKNPKISEIDKQILFPSYDNNYVCIYPLYPTSLTHETFLKINEIKYSENNKVARRHKKEKTGLINHSDILDIAYVKLGGKKPLNVSVFNKDQNGRNYLLPSVPPIFRQSQDIRISPNATSIFATKALQYKAKEALNALFTLIKTDYNNVNIREARKAILSDIAYQVISIGETIQTIRPAGWSKDYHNLSMNQKYWLDPKRAELDGEDDFKTARETEDWRTAIEVDFANWLQGILKTEFKAFAHDFADPEHNEWRREIADEIKKALRLGKGGLA